MSDDTRTRILAAAGPVFAEKGFQAATVREICQEADVNVAAINYYFGDKERLYIETVKRAHQMQHEQVAAPEWPEDTAAETKLYDFVLTLLTTMIGVKTARWQNQLLMREMVEPSTACRELVQENVRPRFEMLLGILDELLPPDFPRFRRHQVALSVVGQCVHYHVGRAVIPLLVNEEDLREEYTPRQLARHITDFTLASLGLHPPLTETSETGTRASVAGKNTR